MELNANVDEIVGTIALLHSESGKFIFEAASFEVKPEDVLEIMQVVRHELFEKHKLLLIEIDPLKDFAVCTIEELKADGGVVIPIDEVVEVAKLFEGDEDQFLQYITNKINPKNLN